MADIELPQLGESVTEGTITRWFKAVGDQVDEDEPLFEVSTDKVDSEVPSPMAGFLTEILVEEGETVDVGTRLAVVSDAPAGAATPAGGESAAPEPAPAEPEPEPEAEPVRQTQPETAPAPSSAPEPPQSSEAGAGTQTQPTDGRPTSGSAGGSEGSGQAPLLSPVVRRLLDDAGVDPAAVAGTGVGGRITRADVEGHLRSSGGPGTAQPQARPPAPAPAPAPAATSSSEADWAPAPAPSTVVGEDSTVALNKIRTITAQHMVNSLETSAHAYVGTEVDYEAVERVRRAHRETFRSEEGVSLTYLPFVARAMIDALGEFPLVNSSMGDDSARIVVHGSINLGVAVDLDHDGLIVPVLRDAQDQRLRAVARNVAELADRARNKGLTADDITGGTVTITNVGSTGNLFLLPVINQPQVMILSTDGVARRPVVVTDPSGSESIAIHSVGNLTLGWDHRAFDGAYAAQFLARVKEILETRDWTTEL